MTSTPSSRTGANVRAEMARRGISQTSLALVVHISQPGLSKRLRGVTPFDINELTLIADHLGVPVTALIATDDAKADAS